MTPPHLSAKYLTITIRLGIVLALCCVFVGVALAASLTDSTINDFSQGSGDCFVSQADTGQTAGAVIVSPIRGTNFSGTVLASDWYTSSDPGNISALANGNLYVNEGRAGTLHPPFFAPSRTLEFVATFITNTQDQNGGFGQYLTDAPFAIFSTGTNPDVTGLRVRSNNGSEVNTNLGFGYFDAPHLYRIDWRPTGVTYWIDGTPVATHTIDLSVTDVEVNGMRPIFADFNTAAVSLTLNWMRMSDYAPSPCTFTSRVINSGADNTSWTNFTTTVARPTGTSISFDVRASVTNTTWPAWEPVTSNAINVTGRYVQYRATLTTTDPLVTSQLLSADFGGSPLAVGLTSFSAGTATSDATRWRIAALAACGLLLGLSGVYLIRLRKQI